MKTLQLSLLALAIAGSSAQAIASEDLGNLISGGKAIVDARYRYEFVDEDNAKNHANAQTLRTRIGFQSGQWYGLSGLVEADNVSHIGDEVFNSTRNGQAQFSTVPDPDGTEINQALLRYDHKYGSAVAGRQRINLDNQRYIGGVGWRQNEQTYDGGLIQLKPLTGLTLTAAYIDNINTIFGPDNGQYDTITNPANIEGHSQLYNVQYVVMPELTVTGYVYQLGLDNIAVAPATALGTLASQTNGLRLSGVIAGVSYAAEYAQQKDYEDNPNQLDSKYYLAELGYTIATVALKGGYEVLGGGNDGKGKGNLAFQTPLATKHAFQGWADMFLTTPVDGVKDAYLGASMPLLGGTAQVAYHDFRAEQSSPISQYGDEFDISYAHPIPGVKGLVAMVKYADYDANDYGVDTRKFWTQVQYSY